MRALATPGTPSTALNADITQGAPAAIAAWNGGSCVSRIARSERSMPL